MRFKLREGGGFIECRRHGKWYLVPPPAVRTEAAVVANLVEEEWPRDESGHSIHKLAGRCNVGSNAAGSEGRLTAQWMIQLLWL